MRRYEVSFKCSSETKPTPVREVKADCIGKLVSIRGIVTRATEVIIMENTDTSLAYFLSLTWRPG